MSSIYGNYLEESYNDKVIKEGIIQTLKNMYKSRRIKKLIAYDCDLDKKPNDKSSKYYTSNYYSIRNNTSPSISIKQWICACYKATLEKGKLIFLNKSKYNELIKDNHYLYILKYYYEYNSDPKIVTNGDEEKRITEKFLEITDEGNVVDLMQKYSIEYEIRDNSAIINRRRKMFNDACAIARKIISDAAKEDPQIKKGFSVPKFDKDDSEYEDFINNISHDITIVDCDAWGYTNNKARDEAEYDKYNTAFGKIYVPLNNAITKSINDADIDYAGDWDDGPIILIDIEKKKK